MALNRIIFTARACRDLEALEGSVRERIREKLGVLAAEPLKHARRLSNTRAGSYRLRIGDYRVIVDLDGSELVVLRVGHRRDIYR